jgi:uncharacterized membrane protein (DUF2068 family)
MAGQRARGLFVIALFKLLKAATLVALGVGALLLVKSGDHFAQLRHFVSELRIDPDNRLIHRAMTKLSGLDARKLERLGVGTFVYALVFLVEGVGLLLRRRWAEYLTTIVTASFVPFEVYEMVRSPSILKALGIVVNISIVVYLVARLRKKTSP